MMVSRRHFVHCIFFPIHSLGFVFQGKSPSENKPIVCRKRVRQQPGAVNLVQLALVWFSKLNIHAYSKACFPVSAFRDVNLAS
jgi:hypothetical protein